MNYRNRALLNLAKDAPCMNCGKQDGTTVAAHSNYQIHGKGMGIKAHDCYTAFLCFECHKKYDERSGGFDSFSYYDFVEVVLKTYLYLWKNGLIKVA